MRNNPLSLLAALVACIHTAGLYNTGHRSMPIIATALTKERYGVEEVRVRREYIDNVV